MSIFDQRGQVVAGSQINQVDTVRDVRAATGSRDNPVTFYVDDQGQVCTGPYGFVVQSDSPIAKAIYRAAAALRGEVA